ncbi:MAG TPA: hypothetical protein VKP30_33470, partial [Polyangiaceae bacterium]|nr:hypothetical protein [Polyangiaceae bacterium]
MRRSKSFGFCLVTLLGFNLAACGDGEKNSTDAAGGASKGGSNTGGASAQGGVTSAGATTGGSNPTNTTNVAGAGGGSTATAGGSTAGGATLAGGTTSGGATTGGTSNVSCFAAFAVPADGASLSNSSDLDANCSNGIQMNVLVVTNAAEGTSATLDLQDSTGTTKQLGSTTVGANLQAIFGNVELSGSGQFKLIARVGGPACSATETLKTDCEGAPSCAVSAPILSAAHPILNGVPTSSGGDKVSSNGSAYQAAFTVSTDAEDGQPVSLTVDSAISVQSTVASGKAQFPGVPLSADGPHTVQATCTNKKALSASTAALSYPVDTLAPALAVSKVTGGDSPVESVLASGDHFG